MRELGTRGLIAIKFNNLFIGIVNNFNAYPENLGLIVIEFLEKLFKENGISKFKERLEQIVVTTGNYVLEASFTFKFTSKGNIKIDSVIPRENLENGEFLYRIYNGSLKKISNEIVFGQDGLFCEFGYIINLDASMLEFYVGNKPNFLSNQYGLFPNYISNSFPDGIVYYSIQKIKEYPFVLLPKIEELMEQEY